MTDYPVLAGVVDKADVFKKGPADYISWARIANYLHEKAPGWQFALVPTAEGNPVWAAPDGTGYLMCHFTGPELTTTELFPYSITDNRNAPIPLDRISARTLCDSHRRAMCAAAAFFFSLGYELWAREEVAAAQADEPAKAATKPAKEPPAPRKPEPAKEPLQPIKVKGDPDLLADPIVQEEPATKDEIALILSLLKDADPALRDKVLASYREAFGLDPKAKVAPHISSQAHVTFLAGALA